MEKTAGKERELERERTYLEAEAGEEKDERDADGVDGQLGLQRAADASKLNTTDDV